MLGNIIRTIREDKNITIKELSRLCEIHSSHLSKIETNRRIPSLDVLSKICFNLKVSTGYVLFLSEIDISKAQDKSELIFLEHLLSTANLLNYLLGYDRDYYGVQAI